MALRVYGIINHDPHAAPKVIGVSPIALRDLAAVVEAADYSVQDVGPSHVARHLEVVTALFNQDAVLPAPVGTVFRNTEILERWMDLHYVALSDALAWVEDRVAARVHIHKVERKNGIKEGFDLAAVAADVTRSLRRHAVSTVPLRDADVAGVVLSAAYLVERQIWKEFVSAAEEEQDRHSHIRVDVTGPWPPYDFVRVQFGA